MGEKLISERRLRRMLSRQSGPAWGSNYQPAMKATRDEAPRISRPTILQSGKIGRPLHLMSLQEVAATLLALHHPNIFDIQEQRLLSTVPATHPLFGHPRAAGMTFGSLRGTISVAERMGVLASHPKIYLHPDPALPGRWVAFNYIGDLLLFIEDEAGPYCLNWTVKKDAHDFSRASTSGFFKPRRAGRSASAERRHAIESTYYADAGIRTVQVAGADLDRQLVYNLRQMFLWHSRPCTVPEDRRAQVTQVLASAIGTDVVAFHLIAQIAKERDLTADEVKTILMQGIWNREVIVDLFTPVLMDRPLKKQIHDPLTMYVDWFAR